MSLLIGPPSLDETILRYKNHCLQLLLGINLKLCVYIKLQTAYSVYELMHSILQSCFENVLGINSNLQNNSIVTLYRSRTKFVQEF